MPEETLTKRIEGAGFRRSTPPPRYIPLALRSAVHQQVTRGRFPPVLGRQIVLVKWVIRGEAAIGVEGRRFRFGPGDVAVHVPPHPHQFWSLSEPCEMCWFSVDGPLLEEFALAMGLRPGVYPYGPAPVQQIHQMIQSLQDYTLSGQRRASLLGISMLYDIADRIRTPQMPSVVRQAQQLIHAEFADPDLSVDIIAQRLNYHRGSLSRAFHKHTGVRMIDYLTQVRLQHARTLLLHTEERITGIAQKCGFRDVKYFCRWISKHTGISPNRLRRDAVL